MYGALKQFTYYFRILFKVDIFHRIACMPLTNQQCLATLQKKKNKKMQVVNMSD